MKLKVCGMKYKANIAEVVQLQPDYLGFIFYEKSSRYFEGIIPDVPKSIKKVGVFVNASIECILEKIETYNLQAVQLHGDESPEFCNTLKIRHSEFISESHHEVLKQVQMDEKIEVIKVFSIKDHFDFSVLEAYEDVCKYFLFDTKGQLPGGNGYTFNWNILKDYPSTKPFFLSGGIGLDEIESALSFLRKQESKYCYAIDVNSKFEIEAGLKNFEKLKAFKKELSFRT
jgi:phosphoribosylanthranilate isomerase